MEIRTSTAGRPTQGESCGGSTLCPLEMQFLRTLTIEQGKSKDESHSKAGVAEEGLGDIQGSDQIVTVLSNFPKEATLVVR